MGAKKFLIGFLAALALSTVLPRLAESQEEQTTTEAKSKKKAGKNKKKDKDTSREADPYTSDDQAETEEQESEPETEEAGKAKIESQTMSSEGSLRRSNRMEFDERLVKGQAAKSGAVYLFKRTPRALPGLVPMRHSYRRRIVEPVLGPRELKPAVYPHEEGAAQKTKKKDVERAPVEKAKKEDVKKTVDEAGAKPEASEEDQAKKKKGKKRRGGKK
jgi:hypothetical protein